MLFCRLFPLALLCSGLASCSAGLPLRTTVPYAVTSTPPGAEIVIDGQRAGTTPMTIDFFVSRWWIGWLRSPNGWAYGPETYTVTALPPSAASAQFDAETQVVVPGETPHGGTIFFDLRRRPL